MDEKQFLFIDFEFTMPENKKRPHGFYPEIIEVGLVVVKNDTICDTFSSYVRPEKFSILTERCKKFLHITQKEIDEGMTFAAFIARLVQYEKVCHSTVVTWGNMDMKVLRKNCDLANLPYPFKHHRDLSLEYKRFFGDRNQTGLWKAVEAYGKTGTGKHHRALDDAMTTYNIFKLVEKDKQYLLKHEPTTIGDLVDLSKIVNRVQAH